MKDTVSLSVVSPIYYGEKTTAHLVERLLAVLPQIADSFEIILVDDRSPDQSWSEIKRLSEKHPEVKGVRLSRNYGQHYAITAGLDHSKGEWVVVMDCDLQDKPEEIPVLYKKAQEGFEVVRARRHDRQDSFLIRMFSASFYRVLSYLTGTEHDPSIANFGIYHRKVIDSIVSMRESIRYFPSMVNWVGFSKADVNVEHASRLAGESTYNFKRRLNLALVIILAFSDKPLRLTVKAGLLMSIMSFLVGLYMFISYLTGAIFVLGYASLIISIWFLSGLIIMILGIVGLYIGRIFEDVKNRPIYIVDEIV